MNNKDFFSFIFIGDTHGFINDFKKQKEVIENIEPEFVLLEKLQNILLDSEEKYLSIFRNKEISEMVSFDDVKDCIDLCYKKNIKLIGIDFKNFGFSERLQKIVKGELKAANKDKEEMENIVKERQGYHLKIINQYKKESKKPLVIIIGCWHLQKKSPLMKSLNNYLVIYPCDSNGTIITHKVKNSKSIRYCERIKNE